MQTVCQAAGYCRKDTLSTAEQPTFHNTTPDLQDQDQDNSAQDQDQDHNLQDQDQDRFFVVLRRVLS